jgi:predicted NUDIX family NTP pyrophosphohydrolase
MQQGNDDDIEPPPRTDYARGFTAARRAGRTAGDYAERYRQQTGQDYGFENDVEDEEAAIDAAQAEDARRSAEDAQRERLNALRNRANLFIRMVDAENSRGWEYYSTTSIWQRTKSEMKEQGIFVDWLESLPDDNVIRQAELEDARSEANMSDQARSLLARGNMMVRYLERTPRRVENEAFRNTLQRLKDRMKEEGLWDRWWSTVPDSSPLKTSGILDEDQTLVEARNLINRLLGIEQSNKIKININENMGASPEVQRSTTVDEHFLDFLEEKIPSLDVENPHEVKAVIWAIENNETAEQVFKALENQGLVTRHMDSAVETTMWQIRQIQTIMTSHWFGKIEQLYEGKRKQTVGILPYRMIDGEIEFLIGEMTNAYHALPDEKPEPDFQSKWTCFKGRVDDGEDEKSAARREFQEESTFTWDGQLDDSKIIQNRKVKIWLVDAADFDPSNFNRDDVHKITGDYLNGMPEVWSIDWFTPEETQSKLTSGQKDLIPQAIEILTDSVDIPKEPKNQGAAMSFALNENENIEVLHIFDFDDTIAFTETLTVVTAPNGRKYKVDQAGLDKLLKSVDGGEDELRAKGFDLDFSGFKTVSPDSELNPVIARRIDACCLAGDRDPNGDFYVLTARAAAAEGPIHQYLADNGIEIDRSKVIGVEGKSKASRIKSLISDTNVKKIIFYDDSDNNIKDVAGLKQDPELQDVTFELYPVDKQGNIPKKPLQETIYEHKRFKIRIGAK